MRIPAPWAFLVLAAALAGCARSPSTPAAAPEPEAPADLQSVAFNATGLPGEWTLAFWPLAEPAVQLDLAWRLESDWTEGGSSAFLWRLGPLPVATGPDGQWLVRPPGGADVLAAKGAGNATATRSHAHSLGDPDARFSGILFGFAGSVPWSMRLDADPSAALSQPIVLAGPGATFDSSDPAPAVAGVHEVRGEPAGPGLRHVQFASDAVQPVALRSYALSFADGARREAPAAVEAGVDGPAAGLAAGEQSWAYFGHFDGRGGMVSASLRSVAAELDARVVLVSLPIEAGQLPGSWRPDYEGT